MKTKICFKCSEEKLISNFYKHKGTTDGRLNKCKKCTKKDATLHRRKNIEYYRAYDRARGSRQSISDIRRYRKENPEKYAAHIALNNAIRDGKITKQPCQKCKSKFDIHGHHKDYSKPLEVNWLCNVCHANLPRGKNHTKAKIIKRRLVNQFAICRGISKCGTAIVQEG